MIRPIDLHDQLTKTPLLERVQQAEKVAEEGQQKFQQLFAQHTAEKQMQATQPTHQDEKIVDTYEKHRQAQQEDQAERDKEKQNAGKTEPDEDEPVMTQLGFEIDLMA